MPLDISRQTLETERVVDSRIIKALIETDAMAQGADEVLLCDAMCSIDSAGTHTSGRQGAFSGAIPRAGRDYQPDG